MTSKLDTSGLVERLRAKQMRVHDLSGVGWEDDPDCIAAADLIEALTQAAASQLSAIQEREREWDAAREGLRLARAWDFPADIQDLTVRLEAAEARVAELEAGDEVARLLVQADDVWEDYGSGFRIHFSFHAAHSDKVVERVHTFRSRAAMDEVNRRRKEPHHAE